jgi:hypothetical protein
LVGDGDGEGLLGLGLGDGGGAGAVTFQVKVTEPVPPDGFLAVMVTAYSPRAPAGMVPLIRPLPLIDRPGGRPVAVKAGACPAVALSDLTCSWSAVPAVLC